MCAFLHLPISYFITYNRANRLHFFFLSTCIINTSYERHESGFICPREFRLLIYSTTFSTYTRLIIIFFFLRMSNDNMERVKRRVKIKKFVIINGFKCSMCHLHARKIFAPIFERTINIHSNKLKSKDSDYSMRKQL